MAGLKGKMSAMSPVRRKQMFILGGLVVVVGGIAFGAAMLGAPKKLPPPKAPESTRKAFGAQGEQVNTADVWRTQEGARLTQLQQQLAEMQQKMAAREKQDSVEKKREEEAAAKKLEEEKLAREKEREEADRRARAAPPSTGLPVQTGALGTPGVSVSPPAFFNRSRNRRTMLPFSTTRRNGHGRNNASRRRAPTAQRGGMAGDF